MTFSRGLLELLGWRPVSVWWSPLTNSVGGTVHLSPGSGKSECRIASGRDPEISKLERAQGAERGPPAPKQKVQGCLYATWKGRGPMLFVIWAGTFQRNWIRGQQSPWVSFLNRPSLPKAVSGAFIVFFSGHGFCILRIVRDIRAVLYYDIWWPVFTEHLLYLHRTSRLWGSDT